MSAGRHVLFFSIVMLALLTIPEVLPLADATISFSGLLNGEGRTTSRTHINGATVCAHEQFENVPLRLTDGSDACTVTVGGQFAINDVVSPDPGITDIVLRFSSFNDFIRVEDSNNNLYQVESELYMNFPDGGTGRMNKIINEDNMERDQMWAFWLVNDLQDARTYFLNEVDEEIRPVTLQWENGFNTTSSYYSNSVITLNGLGDPLLIIEGAKVHDEWVVLHEYGHHVMHDVYAGHRAASDCQRVINGEVKDGSHTLTGINGVNCSWFEGWANFVPHLVTGKSEMEILSTTRTIPKIYDIEEPSYDGVAGNHPAFDKTEKTEGRVAATLWDLEDFRGTDEDIRGHFDDYIWPAFIHHQTAGYANTFKEFQENWDAIHPSNARSDLREAMVLNTIIYLVAPEPIDDLGMISVTTNSVTLGWTLPHDNGSPITRQELVRQHSGSADKTTILTPDITRYKDTNLTDGETYTYFVRAYNEHGFSTSNSLNVETKQIPPHQPRNPRYSDVTDKQVTISWEVPNVGSFEITGYEILRSSSPFVSIATVTADTLSYVDNDVSPDTRYQYKINAHTEFGTSSSSEVITVRTLPSVLPVIRVSDIVVPPNNGEIILDASQTTGTGDVSFLWHQGGNGAPLGRFSNADTAIASFVPPFVSQNQRQEFIFLIDVTDSAGTSREIVYLTLDLVTRPIVIPPPIVTNPGEFRTAIFADQFGNFSRWDEHSEWDLEAPEYPLPVGIDTNNIVAHIEDCPDPPCAMVLQRELKVVAFDRLELSFWMLFEDQIQVSDQLEVEGMMVQRYNPDREWDDLGMVMVDSQNFGVWFKTTMNISSLIGVDDVLIRLIPMIERDDSIIQIDALQIDGITLDNTPPVFDPISDIHSTTDSSGGVIVDYPLPTASDAEIKNVEVFCNPQSGIVFPIGTTMVTCTSNDSAGNTATVTFNVIVTMLEDTVPPTIIVPDDVTAEVTCPGTSVNLGQATAIDNTDSNPTITSNSTTQFPLGTNIVIWTATDASGNMANATQTVTIRDTTNPVLVPIDNLVSESITVNDYANMAPSVTDNSCDIITPTHDAPESFPVGTTTVTWTATDSAGNSASTTHTVTIQDVAPPIIMAPLDVISEVTCPGTAVNLGTAVTSDNYDPSPQIRHDAPDSFPVGTTTVTWTATDDSGNMATDEQLVTIRDTTKPVLGSIDNLVSEPITVHDYANMAPSVTDNSCDVITPTHNAPESFPLGDTIVTWTATDMAGNSASTTHTVTIHTAELMIIAPFDVTAEVTCPGTTVSLGMAAVSDNYNPSPQIRHDAPDSFPLGTTTVTWTATDSAGTVATDTQQVTVRDTTAPGIRQVNDITQESAATLTPISLTAPGTVDNSCDVPTLTHDAPGSFPVGITIVTWTATDSSGNSAKAIQIITILGDGMSQPLQAYRIISNILDDSNRSQDHSLVRLGDTFVLAHKNGGQGVIRSFDVSSDGRSITQLDALPHRSGLNEDMIQIGDNTLALVYAGNIDTLRVTDGDITPIKTHGIGSGYGPELVRLGHDTYALAYGYNSKSSDVSILRIPSHGNEVEHLDRVAHASTRTVNHNGVYMDSGIFVMAYSSLGGSNLVTFSVSSSNQISKLADMQYYPKKSFGTSVVAIDEDTVALGYTSLEGAYVKTYNVATNGTLSYVSQAKIIGSLSVDINIVHLSGQTYLAAYSDGGYGGWMRPLLIDNDGSITMGPAVMHDDQALYGSLVRADDDTAVFAYQGANSVSKIAILGVVTPEP